jgi:hypothetical protein
LIEKNTCNEGMTLQAGDCGFMSTGSLSDTILIRQAIWQGIRQ